MSDSASSPSLTVGVGSHDIREMSFQNVVDRILRPSGIKMGGFPMEMFVDLSDADQQKFMCNICYMIANECRCCDNKHVFCRSCILAWSMTFGENSQKCPFCRCDQTEYHDDKELDNQLKDKTVCCHTEGCSYKAPLRFFLTHHSHGRTNYSNADVDFSRIQAEQHRLFPFPSLAVLEGSNVAAGAMDIREQLLQGRMMIHQMMLLMHLEMQLRQQALVSYQETQDRGQRMRRLDDVMALNEQLNEVGSILGALLNAPLDRGASIRHAASTFTESPQAGHHSFTVGGRFGASVASESSVSSLLPTFRFRMPDADTDDEDDDDDDDNDDDEEVVADSTSFAASSVADADDDDESDEDLFIATSSSSGSSVQNSYNFDSLTSSNRRPARITVNLTVGAERVSAGVSMSASSNGGISHPSAPDRQHLASTTQPASTSVASNGYSSVVLSRQRNRPATPRWPAVERSRASVTVNELHLSAGVGSQAGVRTTTQSETVTLPQIQSSGTGVIAASQIPVTQNVHRERPAVNRRQLPVSSPSTSTPRQLDSLLENRSHRLSSSRNCSTTVITNGQTLPATRHLATSTSGGASSSSVINTSLDTSSDYSTNRSGVSTGLWPVLSTAEPRSSTFVSTSRSRVAQPAARPSHRRGSLATNLTNTDSHFASARLPAGAAIAAHGPPRAVPEMHNNRPALQLRRSSRRNALGRPAGPASLSTLHPSAPQRTVPLPHPPARGGRQQGFGDHNTAASRNYASNGVLRPRRRSEIAHDIMFPPQTDNEQ